METLLLLQLLFVTPTVPPETTTDQAIEKLETLLPGIDIKDGAIILLPNPTTKRKP